MGHTWEATLADGTVVSEFAAADGAHQSLRSLDPRAIREVRLLRAGSGEPVAVVTPGPGDEVVFIRRRQAVVSLSGGSATERAPRVCFGLRRGDGAERVNWYL